MFTVDPTFLTLEEDPPFGQQDEGVQKTITCHTDSANPPVIIKWTSDISGDLDAVTTLGSGENGGQTASSVVNRELSKSMNGERITCEAAHGSNVVENLAQSTTLHVKCMYTVYFFAIRSCILKYFIHIYQLHVYPSKGFTCFYVGQACALENSYF